VDTPVSDLIIASFRQALERYSNLHSVWIRISFRIGGLLPKSALSHSVQRYGELDLVLRCMEDELAPRIGREEVNFQYQQLLSEMWIGGGYEILRLLNERKLSVESDNYRTLFRDLELLRITIDKHDIAGQGKLKEPLEMTYYEEKDVYLFIKDDPQRSHIMPAGISAQGSLVWQVIDLKAEGTRWVDRRSLSDRMIALWGEQS
jgi:hypothetical protein